MGRHNAQISDSHMTGQSSDLHIGGEFSSESFSTSTSSSSEPSDSLEALGQNKVDGAARRDGRVWSESSSGVTHSTHTVHTECTDSTPGQVLSQDIVCKLVTVQSVQNSGFSVAKVHKTTDAK